MPVVLAVLVLIFGLAVPLSPAAAQDLYSAQVSTGVIAPLGTSAVRSGIEGEASPGLAFTAAVARRLITDLDVRLGLLVGLGSDVTLRFDDEACAAAQQVRPRASCQSERGEILMHLYLGPSYRFGKVSAGVDIGARAQGWTTACVLIAVLCLARSDYLGVSAAVHPNVAVMLSPLSYNLRIEFGTYWGSYSGQQRTDLTFLLGLVF
jgi:hypothetical protein